ncbi:MULTISPECIES: extracellular solute-binding protein [Chelativorans]|jgi:putative spermidine/putrescine transport system substrate-binding protein|uniref:Putative spermidine/putrescine transport system substrate-binding protein n=1 Tax=Chelativorans sp. (strain BNC1) TaxID=266779 RepID=Q11GZ6_CHESB|nr:MULTISPECIES: extracellular solute-binding protein [Chelativorans]
MKTIELSRRNALKVIAGSSALLAAPAILSRSYAQEGGFSVGIPGGYEKAFQTAFLDPYEQEFGIKPTPILAGTSTVEIKAQVETGKFFYDVRFSVAATGNEVLAEAGLLERIDDIDSEDVQAIYGALPEAQRRPTFLPHGLSAQVIAFQDHLDFKDYADIWDVENLPGARALRGQGKDTIEAALRSMGKRPSETASFLANEDGWKQVFARLDEIKDHVTNWWEEDSDITRLLGAREVDVTAFPHHRAMAAVQSGARIKYNYSQSMTTALGWVIPKNSPQAEAGRKFIAFCSRPDRIADFTMDVPMGPMHPDVMALLDPAFAVALPTHPNNVENIESEDVAFWHKNQGQANERFKEWLLG